MGKGRNSKRKIDDLSANSSSMEDPELIRLKEVVEKLTQQVADVTTTMTQQLAAITSQLAEQVALTTKLVKELGSLRAGNQVKSNFPFGAPPSSSYRNTLTADLAATNSDVGYLAMSCDILRNAVHVAAKNQVAVVERLFDDHSSGDAKKEFDLCKEVAIIAGITPPTAVWRHVGNARNQSGTRCRPLKVKFESAKDRDAFIVHFRKSLPSDTAKLFPGRLPLCRRDMCPMELKLLYQLRQECYERNKAAGRFVYYVRDLTMCEATRHVDRRR
jgi:hypothetical protein